MDAINLDKPMKYKSFFILTLAGPMVCQAYTPAPYAGQRALLDRIAGVAASQSQTSAVALELLEQVALGRSAKISPESEARVGVGRGELQKPEFNDPTVRACAFRKIGETGLREALDFLTGIQPADAGVDPSQQVWPAAQIALQNARLIQIADSRAKIEFLESMLTEQPDSRGPVSHWAVNWLCDNGALPSLAVIQQSIRAGWSGQRGEDEIRFCEARLQVIARYSDRVKALGSLLTRDNAEDERLLLWAIYQLAALRLKDADTELNRFATEIGSLPDTSAQKRRLLFFKQEIDRILRVRSN